MPKFNWKLTGKPVPHISSRATAASYRRIATLYTVQKIFALIAETFRCYAGKSCVNEFHPTMSSSRLYFAAALAHGINKKVRYHH